jgi:hypothetical protein
LVRYGSERPAAEIQFGVALLTLTSVLSAEFASARTLQPAPSIGQALLFFTRAAEAINNPSHTLPAGADRRSDECACPSMPSTKRASDLSVQIVKKARRVVHEVRVAASAMLVWVRTTAVIP